MELLLMSLPPLLLTSTSTATCFRTAPILPLMWQTKFHTNINLQSDYIKMTIIFSYVRKIAKDDY